MTYPPSYPSGGSYVSQDLLTTLSSEYTTSMLIDNTVAALPAYAAFGASPGSGQGTTCSALADTSTDETSRTIRRFKFKFHFSCAHGDGTITWVERFTPSGGGSVTDTDRSMAVGAGTNDDTAVTEVIEPSSNGTITIVNIRFMATDYYAYFGCDTLGHPAMLIGQGCVCVASRSGTSGGCCEFNPQSWPTLSRFKYKFKFPNLGTGGYLKILWNETFKPILSASVTYCGFSYAAGAEDPNPVHWTKTARSEIFGSGQTESSEHSVNEPSSNGTIYITDIRWTNTEGCEPSASSIEGVDQFASSTSTTYLCNSRTKADKNCTCS